MSVFVYYISMKYQNFPIKKNVGLYIFWIYFFQLAKFIYNERNLLILLKVFFMVVRTTEEEP